MNTMKTGMMTADGKMVPSRTWWYLREVSNVDPTRILNVTGKGDLKTLTWDEIELLWKTLTGTDL